MQLPSSTSSSEKRGRRVVVAMLIAVGACALIDLASRWLLPMADIVVQNTSAREYFRAEPVPDVQIFGDSVIWRALLADSLSGGGVLTVRNDALAASRPPTTYFLIREQFAAGRLPRAIVFAHIPLSFDDAFTARLAATFVEWRELPAVYRTASRPTDALFGTLARFSYLLMNRNQFQSLLLRGDYEFFIEERGGYATGEAERNVAAFLADSAAYEASVTTFDGSVRDAGRALFSAADETDAYFRRTLALAKTHGVPVFWLTPPVSETVDRGHEEAGFYEGLAAYLGPFEQSGDLTVLQIRPEVYPDDLFTDAVHPKPSAALLFSCAMRRYAPVIVAAVAGHGKHGRGKAEGYESEGGLVRALEPTDAGDWTGGCDDSESTWRSIDVDSPVVDASH